MANVLLGKSLQLTAVVTGTINTAVTWTVSGITGGNAVVGTISPSGLYNAPLDLPSPATVTISAATVASPSVSGTAQVTVTSDLSVSVSPANASVELGAAQNFAASLASAGLPDKTIRWSLSGASCPSACGSIDSAGNYTAPQVLPSPASVMLTAQSVADPSRQGNVPVIITSRFILQLSAPSAVNPSATATVVGTLTPIPGSRPSTVLNWSLSGPGCGSSSCGTLSAVTTQVQGASGSSGTFTETANYTAPISAPVPDLVTITATPLADPGKRAQVTIAVQPGVVISLSPQSTSLAINHRLPFAVQISGTENSRMAWSVNGVSGGNAALGQVCVANSNPCLPVTVTPAPQVDYLAPAALPFPNPVTVTAASSADPSKTASAQVTILNHLVVSVIPASVSLPPAATQVFAATVAGTANQGVVWQLRGSACSTSGACGSISTSGTYTAPGTPPNPNAIQVVAVSSEDTSQSGFANVTIASGANLSSLHPASVYAGGQAGFVLRVDGGGLFPTTSGPGSTLLIGGNSRTTSCLSAMECTAAVFPSDVALPGTVDVQIQNPDGSRSNTVGLVVAPSNSADDSIALTGASPSAFGKDIVVVEPTSAGVSVPGADVDLNIAALGTFSVGSNTCLLGGNPIVLMRPPSGAATVDICVFSESGLDTSMSYIITGPSDVTVAAKQPAGLGIIHLTLQVQATAQTGARTLFIQNLNLDKTAASGVLEVQ